MQVEEESLLRGKKQTRKSSLLKQKWFDGRTTKITRMPYGERKRHVVKKAPSGRELSSKCETEGECVTIKFTQTKAYPGSFRLLIRKIHLPPGGRQKINPFGRGYSITESEGHSPIRPNFSYVTILRRKRLNRRTVSVTHEEYLISPYLHLTLKCATIYSLCRGIR